MTPSFTQSSSADIRTFRAADSRAALSAIKAALGSDAVILRTREVASLFGKPEIEVTAARGEPAVPVEPRPAARPVRSAEFDEDVTPAQTGPGQPPQRSDVFRQLVQRGVDEELAADLVGQALKLGAGAAQGDLLAEVRRLVRDRLRPAPAPWQPTTLGGVDGQRVMALVGPTGVGKTTTLAKIAARAILDAHLKVALITVDTYRLGASDQLARYGKIMGVRAHIARDDAALADAAAQSREADLVLIDTAGRSDPGARKAQVELLRTLPGVELHLVLSAATGPREIAAMARKYEPMTPDYLIFSKIDEADGPGAVLSAASIIPRPVCCITDGQRVPEDIHPVTTRILASLVFASQHDPRTTHGDLRSPDASRAFI